MALIICTYCGAPISANATACPKCGAPASAVCSKCGAQVVANAKSCPNCGADIVRNAQPGVPQQNYSNQQETARKDKTVAGILALFLGCLGIDLFYCGKNKAGLVTLLVCIFVGWTGIAWLAIAICSLIRGIRMLTMTQEEFEARYVYSGNEWSII